MSFSAQAQEDGSSDSLAVISQNDSILPLDTLSSQTDSIAQTDSVSKPTKERTQLDYPIVYSARDSIILSGSSGNAYLFGESSITYGQTDLKADFIKLNTDSSLISANGTLDEDSVLVGTPIFMEGGEEYKAKTINYDFRTKKGFITRGVIQQGESFIISEQAKKVSDDIMCMTNGKYTTCDHEHPHFYLHLTKAKVKQKKWVVTGPAYLVVADVPLPLALPFGYFPFTQSYSSGVIIPSYGDDLARGFFLTGGGYYFAISDHIDLTLTGDIYTKGTWALNAASTYIKRYKYRGSFNASYRQDVMGEKGLQDYSKMHNLNLSWTHSQDPKASPNRTLSASVNFSTSGYDRSNVQNYANAAVLSQNTKSSSISFSYRFPDSPFSLSTSVLVNQRTADSTISLTLPDLTLTMSRIYPFKRKNAIGNDRWYEKIYLSYDARIGNSITTKEKELMSSSLKKDWQNGLSHSLRTGASFNVLRYISITPTANFNARMYFSSIGQEWDESSNSVHRDTTYGFYVPYDFNVGISLSTKLYGFFTPLRKLFGDKIDRIRHVITPTLSYSFTPDFGKPMWGTWKSYTRPIDINNPTAGIDEIFYSRFEGGMYGAPGQGMSNSINFSLGNNLEMKWKHANDSTGEPEYKVISLIDALNISNIGYNFAADSLNWSNCNVNLRLKFTQSLSLSLSGGFETYIYGLNAYGNPVRINTPRWEVGKAPRLISTSTSFSYTFSNSTFKKKNKKGEQPQQAEGENQEQTETLQTAAEKDKKKKTEFSDDGYQKISIPWSLSFDYSIRFGNTEFDKGIMEYKRELSHNLGIRGSISPTPKWSINFNASYDFNLKEITYSSISIRRDLHCWSMSANVVPFGPYKNYNFLIQVNASMLADLKHEIHSDYHQENWY